MTPDATVLAERLRSYIEWSGWYGTAPEPDEYEEVRTIRLSLDERNTVVQMLAAALDAVRRETWEEAAKVAESWIGEMDHDDQTCRCIAIDLRAQAEAGEGA